MLRQRPWVGGLGLAPVCALILMVAVKTGAARARPPEPPVPHSATAITLNDAVNYYQGPYLAYASDWSVTGQKLPLRRGVDYLDTIFVEPATFPAGTQLHWSWPEQPATKTGVYGYMHVAYGYYAGGPVKAPVPSKRIKDVRELKALFKVSNLASDGQHNLLTETFLTGASGDFATRGVEIGFLTHMARENRRFFDKGRSLGHWTDPSGRVWRVSIQNKFCMLTPADGSIDEGVLDFGAVFRWLVEKGELTGEEWFNGLAVGVEPVAGSGAVALDEWQIHYH